MTRNDILAKAADIVGGHRVKDYGEPEDNFGIIAQLWSAYLGIDISSVDVSMLMVLFKSARVKSGTGTLDSFIDIAGYAACGGEIAASGTPKSGDNAVCCAAKKGMEAHKNFGETARNYLRSDYVYEINNDGVTFTDEIYAKRVYFMIDDELSSSSFVTEGELRLFLGIKTMPVTGGYGWRSLDGFVLDGKRLTLPPMTKLWNEGD